MAQLLAAMRHDLESENGGSGFEHQSPHLYSQVGVGDTVIVDVHKDTVGVNVGLEDVVETRVVLDDWVDVTVDRVDVVVLLEERVVSVPLEDTVDVDVVLEDRLVVGVLLEDRVDVDVVLEHTLVVSVLLELDVDVCAVIGEVVVVLELGGGGGGGTYPHGSMDWRSEAKYTSNALGPPQVSLALPVQGILQLLLSRGALQFPVFSVSLESKKTRVRQPDLTQRHRNTVCRIQPQHRSSPRPCTRRDILLL
jgi:hypothetical protein